MVDFGLNVAECVHQGIEPAGEGAVVEGDVDVLGKPLNDPITRGREIPPLKATRWLAGIEKGTWRTLQNRTFFSRTTACRSGSNRRTRWFGTRPQSAPGGLGTVDPDDLGAVRTYVADEAAFPGSYENGTREQPDADLRDEAPGRLVEPDAGGLSATAPSAAEHTGGSMGRKPSFVAIRLPERPLGDIRWAERARIMANELEKICVHPLIHGSFPEN